jgi:hypothetical protein
VLGVGVGLIGKLFRLDLITEDRPAGDMIAAGGLTIEDPRHLALTHALLTRSLRALEELDAFDLPLASRSA